jgi:hypothetical protein
MAALRDLAVIADWAAAAICDARPPTAGSEPESEGQVDEGDEQQAEREAALTI